MPSHNARFCRECFLFFFKRAVTRALKKIKFPQDEPLMVAVSGGKDSLATWDILNELGFITRGLHINLEVDDFSKYSRNSVASFAQERGLDWSEYLLKEEFGYSLPEVEKRFRKKVCSACGKLKRQYLNRLTAREGFKTLVTGHNLDDEASRLLGNLLKNKQEYVQKQHPYLPSPHPLVPARLKPLYRLEIYDIRIYCALKEINPVAASCPFSAGATSHKYKNALDMLEKEMPGTKRGFLFAYLENKEPPQGELDYGTCNLCGHPAYGQFCSLCNLKKQVDDYTSKKQKLNRPPSG